MKKDYSEQFYKDQENRIFKDIYKITGRIGNERNLKEKDRALNYEKGKNKEADTVVATLTCAINIYCESFWKNLPKDEFIKKRPSDNRLLSFIDNAVVFLIDENYYDYYNKYFVKWWLNYNWEKLATECYDYFSSKEKK